MAFDIPSLISSLDTFGFFQYAIPFFIAWMIIFSLFEKTKILGNNFGLNAMLSLLISLTVVTNDTLIMFIGRYLSSISIGLVFLTVVLLVFMFVNGDVGGPSGGMKTFAVVLTVATVLYALLDAQYLGGMYGGNISWWFNDIAYFLESFWPIIALLCVGAIIPIMIWNGRNKKKAKP
jgi:hypothetical protein